MSHACTKVILPQSQLEIRKTVAQNRSNLPNLKPLLQHSELQRLNIYTNTETETVFMAEYSLTLKNVLRWGPITFPN